MLFFYLSLIIFSLIAIVILVGRRFQSVKVMSESEFNAKFSSSTPLLDDVWAYFAVPVINYFHNVIWPACLKESEKLAARVRLFTLKLERQLHDLTNYIRGKRELRRDDGNLARRSFSEGGSAYWGEVKKAGSGTKA